MPIKPENAARYSADWQQISKDIRENRAQNKCENCGVENHAVGYWIKEKFIIYEDLYEPTDKRLEQYSYIASERKPIKIVLTVAHLDHTPENNAPENLKALCQRCHNRHDAKHRAATRRESKLKNQLKLNL
jgi:hypothetical protein